MKKPLDFLRGFLCSGSWNRTRELRVMSSKTYFFETISLGFHAFIFENRVLKRVPFYVHLVNQIL